jgi:hypothetical protein
MYKDTNKIQIHKKNVPQPEKIARRHNKTGRCVLIIM